jgi:exodeoxyribonuclease VII large subunit
MQLALEFEAKVFGVSELTAYLKRTVKMDPVLGGTVLLEGEVSNLKPSNRGHVYFTLKDESASINAVMWASTAAKNKFKLHEGMALIATGDLDFYAPNGSYSLVVKKVEPVGMGALQVAFQQLKDAFEAEGLFASQRKRALPLFPFRVGILTASTGAVIHDMMRVIRAKNPFVDIVLYPVPVQGEGASDAIAKGIQSLADERLALDALIVARGGGSFEDLFCFSEAPVVRAIADCPIPVVTGIGHEPDFGLADAVADFSAATPTMAAEALIPDGYAMERDLKETARFLSSEVEHQLLLSEEHIAALAERLLSRITPEVQRAEHHLLQLKTSLGHAMTQQLLSLENNLQGMEDELKAFSPLHILKRGYSVLSNAETGEMISSRVDLHALPPLKVVLADGSIQLRGYALDEQSESMSL